MVDSRNRSVSQEELLEIYNLNTPEPTSWSSSSVRPDLLSLDYSSHHDIDQSYVILRQVYEHDKYGSSALDANSTLRDETDPLGSFPSIYAELEHRGLIKDRMTRDEKLSIASQYLVSSRNFNPQLYLLNLHADDDFDQLSAALGKLDQLLVEQSQALKTLVEKEFMDFVRSKSYLDSVFNRFKALGLLDEERGFAVAELRNAIDEVTSRTTAIAQPVLDAKTKEHILKITLEAVEFNQFFFNLPRTLMKHIKNGDHESFIYDYRRGRTIIESKSLLVKSSASAAGAEDYAAHTEILVNRVWEEVESIVDNYRQELWYDLSKAGMPSHGLGVSPASTATSKDHITTISKLIELGVDDNPLVKWVEFRGAYLERNIDQTYEKLLSRVRNFHSNLSAMSQSKAETAGRSFISTLKDPAKAEFGSLVDLSDIVELWIMEKKLVEELAYNWGNQISIFIRQSSELLPGKIQETLPRGYKDESAVHLTFSDLEKKRIRDIMADTVNLLATRVCDFFALSSADMAVLPGESRHKTEIHRRTSQDSSALDLATYGFVPPAANSLGTIRYVSQLYTKAVDLFYNLGRLNVSSASVAYLRAGSQQIMDRCTGALCASWLADARYLGRLQEFSVDGKVQQESSKVVEMIEKYETTMVDALTSVMEYKGPQGVSVSSGDLQTEHETAIVLPSASKQTRVALQTQFARTLEIVLESLMQVVAREQERHAELAELGDSEVAGPVRALSRDATGSSAPQLDLLDRYILLTLSNVYLLRTAVFPRLMAHVENSFRVSFRGQRLRVDAVLDQVDITLFENYTKKTKATITRVVKSGMAGVKSYWLAAGESAELPTDVSAFVYQGLMVIVASFGLVAQLSLQLVRKIVYELEDHLAKVYLDELRQLPKLSSVACAQSRIDVEFISRVLSAGGVVSLSPGTEATIALVERTIQESWDVRKAQRKIEEAVERAIASSQINFHCFEDLGSLPAI